MERHTKFDDQIVIRIVGHDPFGVIDAVEVKYMRGDARANLPYLADLRDSLGKAVRLWSKGIQLSAPIVGAK